MEKMIIYYIFKWYHSHGQNEENSLLIFHRGVSLYITVNAAILLYRSKKLIYLYYIPADGLDER